MFLLVYSTIKIRDTQRLPLHLQPRKDQLKSFQYRLRRLQSQLVILPCKNAGRKKKIRLWSTLFSSSTPKMIHVIEKKIFCRHLKKEARKKKTFGLTMTRMDYFPLEKRLVYRKMKLLVPTRISAPKIRQGFQYKSSHLSTLESSIPASDTSFTSSTTSTLQARRRTVPELLRCQKVILNMINNTLIM